MQIATSVFEAVNSQIGLYIVYGAITLLGLAGTWALKKLAAYLDAASVKAVTDQKARWQIMLINAGEALAKCAADAVQEVEDNVRPTILGAAAYGKLSDEQAKMLKQQAIDIAWAKAKACFGAMLEQSIGMLMGGSAPDTLAHMVDNAVQKIAGDSRASGTAPMPDPSAAPVAIIKEQPAAAAPQPATKTTGVGGVPVP